MAAYRTYTRLKDHIAFRGLIDSFQNKLRTMVSSYARAKLLHNEVNLAMSEILSKEIVQKTISCKAGCSFCCYTQVSVTRDEAELLAQKIALGHPIDRSFLYIQGEAANSSDDWYKIPHELRRCVFLTDDNFCSVYEDRPAVCRTNAVLSDPVNCSTEDGKEKPIRLLKTEKADMLVMTAYIVSGENGVLPHMLWQALQKMKNT